MGQETGDSTAEPTAEDENTKRLKVDESNENNTKAWNERQERIYKEREDKKAEDLEGLERRLPDKMPVPRNTAVVYEETASASVSQASQEQYSRENTGFATSAKFYCPCCPNWLFTPQKRYLHLAMQHTVYLPQLGGKMRSPGGRDPNFNNGSPPKTPPKNPRG
eukprot:1141646-Amphidinium_carterae.1